MNSNIAFLCLAHNQFDYLASLSHYFCSDDDGFFLHLDAKLGEVNLTNLAENTLLLPMSQRYRTRWGSFNIVLATLSLLEAALKTDKYDTFILVSGADVPLLTKAQLKEKLASHTNFISTWLTVATGDKSALGNEFFKRHFYLNDYTNPGEAYISQSRFKIYRMLLLNKLIAWLPHTQKFSYSTYAKGSQWWTITRPLAEYIIEQAKNPSLIAQFSSMHAPDEKFFHSLGINSPFANQIVSANSQAKLDQGLHYIDWGFDDGTKVLKTFPLEKVEKAKALGCAFARKIDTQIISEYQAHIKNLY